MPDPWINSSVKGDFYFKQGRAAPSVSATPIDREALFWQSIKDSTDPDMFQEYLRQYPRGSFAGLARLKARKLKAPQVAVVIPPKPSVANEITPAVGIYPNRFKPGTAFKDCSDCPEMVVIPAGSFTMGSPSSEPGRGDDEGPEHRVTIPKPIAVGKFEVTQAEWRAVIGSNPSHYKGDRNPVERGKLG